MRFFLMSALVFSTFLLSGVGVSYEDTKFQMSESNEEIIVDKNEAKDFPLSGRKRYIQTPSDFHLLGVSGGWAPWTRLYRLEIDSTGKGTYSIMYPADRGTGTYTLIDTFTLDSTQLNSIYASILDHGFFDLDTLYEGGATNGSFCELKITAGGNSYKVFTTNIYVPDFDSLILDINAITPGGLDLIYNELNYPNLPGHGTLKRDEDFPQIRQTAVFVERCTIKVIIWLELYGPCATWNLYNEWEQNIEEVWNRNGNYFHVDSCPVVFNVMGHVGDTTPTPGYHRIYVPCDTSVSGDSFISHVHTPLPQPNGASGSGCWDNNEPNNTPAHEAGHLMGLEDEYTDTTDSAGNRVTFPNPGHENDIMATLDGQPTQEEIDQIVSNAGVACPDTCCPVGIVDDDEGALYELCYQEVLDRLNIRYRTYSVSPGSTGPPLDMLTDHAVIIWLTGDDFLSTILPEDAENLMAYIEQGGRLFISGQDIGYDIWVAYPTDSVSQAFYTYYLHSEYVQDYVGLHQLNGVGGTFMEGFQMISIQGGDCADNQFYPSEIDPIEPAFSILKYDTSEPSFFEILIQDFQFNPSWISVPQGAWVRWTNLDPVEHTTTSDAGLWDSGPIPTGGFFDVFFDFPPGIYTYHCSIHPEMTGAVEVITSPRIELEKKSWLKRGDEEVRNSINSRAPISSGSGGIAVEIPQGLDTSKIVYFSFGFEAIADPTTRDSVMSRILNWLLPSGLPEISLFVRGDANADGGINVTDAVFILDHLFPVPTFPCERAADVNLDSTLNTQDVVYFLDNLFPVPNYPPPDSCGENPADILPCDNFPPCGYSAMRSSMWNREIGDVRITLGKTEKREGYVAVPIYVKTNVEVAAFQFKINYDGKYEVWVTSEGCVTSEYDYFDSYIGENSVMVVSLVSLTPSTTGKATGYMDAGKHKVAEIRVKGEKVPEFRVVDVVFSDVYGYEIMPRVESGVLEKGMDIPKVFSLSQNVPNPFKRETEIRYTLPKNAYVELIIYNVMGQKVRRLVSKYETAGYKVIRWDAKDDMGRVLSPGVYFVKMKVEKSSFIRKMIKLEN